MGAPTLPGDVQRLLSWEELPSKVRNIPEEYNPIEEGLLMKHQSDFLDLWASVDLVVVPKGRRTGITFAIGMDSAITAASSREAGGDNIYYIGDTKEKGREFIGYVAHMASVMGAGMADGFMGTEVFLFEDIEELPDGTTKTKYITAYRIRFSSGFEVVALSSNPANIRGLQGVVIIDEAAFHRDVQGVIDAATALLIWGGKICIISTHNGDANPFNEFVKDARAKRNAFTVFEVYFDDAVKNGLYERVCMMKGWQPTAKGKKEWYLRVRGAYGSNRTAMLQELDGIPAEGSGIAIPGVWIERCMPEVRPVIRLDLEDEFALKPKPERRAWIDAWIEANIKPLMEKLDTKRQHCLGEDYARFADLTVFKPAEITESLVRKVPFIVELFNVPTREQKRVLFYIIRGLPRFMGASMDGGGNGYGLAEATADEFGHNLIHIIMLTDKWYRENMGALQEAFEEQMIDLPRNDNIKADYRGLQSVDGVIKPPKVRQKDIDDGKIKRHCDAAIAGALMWHASIQDIQVIAYESIKKQSSQEHRAIKSTQGFGGMKTGVL